MLTKARRLLRRGTDYEVETAAGPGEAIDALSIDPDLALVDVHFTREQRAEGMELADAMRAAGFRGVICMLSFDVRWELVRDALLAGADDYHSKDDVDRHLLASATSLIELFTDRDHRHPGYDPLVDGSFFKSRGCCEEWRNTLRLWVDLDLPDLKVFAGQIGSSYDSVRQRFFKIRKKLEIENNYQLAILAGILTGYGARLRRSEAR